MGPTRGLSIFTARLPPRVMKGFTLSEFPICRLGLEAKKEENLADWYSQVSRFWLIFSFEVFRGWFLCPDIVVRGTDPTTTYLVFPYSAETRRAGLGGCLKQEKGVGGDRRLES